jgi:hypothetical protein
MVFNQGRWQTHRVGITDISDLIIIALAGKICLFRPLGSKIPNGWAWEKFTPVWI